jgi:hypothetical protein
MRSSCYAFERGREISAQFDALISPIAEIGPVGDDFSDDGARIEQFRRLNQWTDLLHQRRRQGERQPKQPDDE